MSSTVDNEEDLIVGYREGHAYIGLSGKLEYEKIPIRKSERQAELRSLMNDFIEEFNKQTTGTGMTIHTINLLETIAKDKHAPVDVLETLSKVDEPLIRVTVAGNPNSSPSILSNLTTDQNFNVRMAVAKNPKTEIDDLDRLSNDSNPTVASFAKQNLKGRDFTGWVFKDTWE